MISENQGERKKVSFAPEVQIFGASETPKQENTPQEIPQSIEEEKESNEDTDASCTSVSEQMED